MTNQIILFLLPLLSGIAVSAGTFAFILVIGVIPRILQRTESKDIMYYENLIILGVIAGGVSSVFPLSLPLGIIPLLIFGVSTGIFVGCIAVALAEILHTFPILFRRFNLNSGLRAVVISMALGKFCGSILYFVFGYNA